MRLSLAAAVLAFGVGTAMAQQPACAPTPEAAAAQALGGAATATPAKGTSGYRVLDVQVDALNKRVWVRVRRCDSETAPALLVPMQANLGASHLPPVPPAMLEQMTSNALPADVPALPSYAKPAPTPAQRVLAVQAGETVRVVMDGANIHMTLEGKAMQAAAVGELIPVELHRLGDEPPHRITGRLRADHTVEVQP